MRSPRFTRAAATAGEAGSRSSSGQVAQTPPCTSASAHQVAKSSRPSPSSSRKRSYAACRAGLRGTACTSATPSAWPPRRCPGPGVSRRCSTAAVLRRSARPVRGPGRRGRRTPRPPRRAGTGADEAASDGQVRRRLQRRARRRGVQGVDQDEAGPEVGCAPASQLAQVGQVAVVPRRAGPHGVQLGHEAPDRPVRHRRRQAEERRRDDHRAAGLGRAARGLQVMPTQRQIGGQLERRLPDERTVDGAGRHVAVDLREQAPGGAVLGLHAHLNRRPVRDVHEDLPGGAGPHHDTGRHHQPPGRVRTGLQGRARLLLGAAATPSAASTAVTVELGPGCAVRASPRTRWPRRRRQPAGPAQR